MGESKVFMILVLILVISCDSSDQKSYDTISKQELDLFTNDIVSGIKKNPSEAFNNRIDVDFLFTRMYEDENLSYSLLDYKVKSGFSNALKRFNKAMEYEILNGSYELIKSEIREDGAHMIFRLFGEGGINIHDFLIVKSENELMIGDIYIYTAGENFSSLLGSIYSSMLIESNLIKKNFSDEKLEEIREITNVRKLLQGGEYQEAFNILEKVDQEFKNEKIWHVLNVESASGLDSATYISAMESFAKQYPDDPSWILMGVDYYLLKGDYTKALNSLDKLQNLVGDDPVFELLKANMYWAKGDYEAAYKLVNANLFKVPSLSDFYFTKASCEGHLRKYDSLENTLRIMNDRFEIEIVELDYYGFEDFQETKGFQRLMEEQGYEYN